MNEITIEYENYKVTLSDVPWTIETLVDFLRKLFGTGQAQVPAIVAVLQ